MKYLLDEQLHETAARALDALGSPDGDSFTFILDQCGPGTNDDEIPALCNRIGADALVTANVRDFGARKRYYEALLEAGVHVIVIRPGKGKFFPANQVALFAGQYKRIAQLLAEAESKILIRVTQSDAHSRSLDELIAEIEAGPQKNP